MFTKLLKACNAQMPNGHRLNICLIGDAGTGKSHASEAVAKALGLGFYFTGAIDTKYDLIGFADANGRVVRTQFREAWEFGGVFCFDELDGSNPGAVVALNAALANNRAAFPDMVVERHRDCIIIAGTNTFLNGSTAEFNGRFKQDAAAADRYVMMRWDVDEKLELALCPDKSWCKRVQGVRARMKERGVKGHKVTPRASFYGAALLASGLDMGDVEAMVLRKGMTDDQWTQVC
jgi:DNA replicative helicase MCM subunit Mcm2 (Cdc46/Mcm family)